MEIDSERYRIIVGALVADAASLGFHWLYDQPTIKNIAPQKPAFKVANESEYQDKGYFAHPKKTIGEPSQYGAQLYAMLDSLTRSSGTFNLCNYINVFKEWFDFGGEWTGYIDKPTRSTLLAMHNAKDNKNVDEAVYGDDDQQLPATSKLPPLVAYLGYQPIDIEAAVRVTNNKDSAVLWALALSEILDSVLRGSSIENAIINSRSCASQTLVEQIDDAMSHLKIKSEVYAQKVGMHCDLSAAFPLIIHILLTSDDYVAAIETNIYCGGDSCGRAIILGAIMAANEPDGIPKEWLDKTQFMRSILSPN